MEMAENGFWIGIHFYPYSEEQESVLYGEPQPISEER